MTRYCLADDEGIACVRRDCPQNLESAGYDCPLPWPPEPTATDEMRDAAAQGLTDRLIP